MAKKVLKKRKRKVSRKKHTNTNSRRIAFSFLSIICLAVGTYFIIKKYFSESESFDSEKYYVKGVDLSHHNPILQWENLLDQNITFAFLKATEGSTHEDRNYLYNYDLAKKANIHVGSYHFYTFALSGKEQAQHFLQKAKFRSGDLLPAIDVEHSSANIYTKDDKYISMVVNELKVLENEIYEHFGVHPIIYTNKDCYKLYIKKHFPDNIIWMCDLQNEPSKNIENWRIWQFSHKGELPGVEGYIDLNYYRYSFEEFKELLLP